ncbi:CBM35 domain-containing protein [Streptomyces sp. NRRL F-4428]|uniref:CBM35 domain-containing protein n=1 Tax=Streptomyces sp. NRRL F-4428 TaxID=1609137 RepID=UPI0005EC6A5C|nr:CBM35 domain-containing protein [Streptomyces sp. NRRL F-4428]KJK47383.1 carbohydrate-binding protein [Streptomyces sp. NRRL F-4428]
MTTPANNGPHGGANKPEDDDPFGYLYADGQSAGATPPTSGGGYGYPGGAAGGHPGAQPGVPRTSHHQVRTVGERRNGGGQRGPVPHQQSPAQQPPGYQAQYQAPEALQAGGYGVPQQPQAAQTQTIGHPGAGHGGRGAGGGASSRRGLLIAAVAVVGAVVIGIGAALAFGDKDKPEDKGADTANGGQQSAAPQNPSSPTPSAKPSQAELPKADFGGSGMSLTGGANLQNTLPGAKSENGQYVTGLNAIGAAATWSLDVPKAGKYKLKMTYGVPGKDASTTLTVNGEAQTRPVNMANFSKAAPGDWAKGWTNTYSIVELKQGANTIKISCETGNQCDVVLDQLWLEQG